MSKVAKAAKETKTDNKAIAKLPGVLSFQRGIVLSDALFFNEIGDRIEPLQVVRHGIRGTQNVNKEINDKDVSNIQVTDSAKCDPEAAAVIVKFDIRFLDLNKALFACAAGKDESLAADVRGMVSGFIARAKESEGLEEVARRYARNILNGRWLWRNRLIAKAIEITVACDGQGLCCWDALSINLNSFERYTAAEVEVAKVIAEGLRGESNATLQVSARIDVGVTGAMEVFCSQNYLTSKPSGFARSLYCLNKNGAPDNDFTGIRIMGQAALRDQKVSNALRTFDTWYPEYELFEKPIAVEPNGASLDEQRFFRGPALSCSDGSPASAFKLIRSLTELDPNSPSGMYMIAALIRGGVYSESSKAKGDTKAEEAVDEA